MTTFNIRDQQAAAINNVGGDMIVEGNFVSVGTLGELRGELATGEHSLAHTELRDWLRAVS